MQRAEIKHDGTQTDRYDPFVVLGRLLGRLAAQGLLGADDLKREIPFRDEPKNLVRNLPPGLVDNAENCGSFSTRVTN